jgi:hypothetical protein
MNWLEQLMGDGINEFKWKANFDYAQSGVTRSAAKEHSDNLEVQRLVNEVDPVFAKIMDNLKIKPPIRNYPKWMYQEKWDVDYLKFLAAYPDVFDYFYPAPDYGQGEKRLQDAYLKRAGASHGLGFIKNSLQKTGTAEDVLTFLLAMRDYYHLKRQKDFCLSSFSYKDRDKLAGLWQLVSDKKIKIYLNFLSDGSFNMDMWDLNHKEYDRAVGNYQIRGHMVLLYYFEHKESIPYKIQEMTLLESEGTLVDNNPEEGNQPTQFERLSEVT